tara:strand:+ start:383 stop:499 length:117 start_codon:yes stop_codon:yes gene_type:complete
MLWLGGWLAVWLAGASWLAGWLNGCLAGADLLAGCAAA